MKKYMIALMLGLFLVGCGNQTENAEVVEETTAESSEVEVETEEATQDEGETEAIQGEDQIETEETAAEDTKIEFKEFSFSDVTDYEFYFSSGAGGWCTVMYIKPDGSFYGNYHDSDMGDIGDGYPDGTLYYCDFTGKFTEPTYVNDYTYQFEIENIEFANEPDTDEIKDNIHYKYTEAYGLENAKEIQVYLPGAPVSELPNEYCIWAYYFNDEDRQGQSLPYYGIYNVNAENGFTSYEMVPALQ